MTISFKNEFSGSAIDESNIYSFIFVLVFREYFMTLSEPSKAGELFILPWSNMYKLSSGSISKPNTEFIPDDELFKYFWFSLIEGQASNIFSFLLYFANVAYTLWFQRGKLQNISPFLESLIPANKQFEQLTGLPDSSLNWIILNWATISKESL